VTYNSRVATFRPGGSRHAPGVAAAIVVLSLLLQSQGFDIAAFDSQTVQPTTAQSNHVFTYEPSTVDDEIAALFPLPWQYSSLALGRSLLAVQAPQSEVAFETGVAAPERREFSEIVRWKHWRCLCQTLDTPPPSYIGL